MDLLRIYVLTSTNFEVIRLLPKQLWKQNFTKNNKIYLTVWNHLSTYIYFLGTLY